MAKMVYAVSRVMPNGWFRRGSPTKRCLLWRLGVGSVSPCLCAASRTCLFISFFVSSHSDVQYRTGRQVHPRQAGYVMTAVASLQRSRCPFVFVFQRRRYMHTPYVYSSVGLVG